MITILGAGGAISNELVKLLVARKEAFRLVSRRAPMSADAKETVAADLSDREQAARAVAGSSVVYLLAGLKYDHKLRAENVAADHGHPARSLQTSGREAGLL